MSRGPCMCGDVYCPSCGNPSAAAAADAAAELTDRLDEMQLSAEEYGFLLTVVPAWIQAQREEIERRVRDKQFIDYVSEGQEDAAP